MTERSASPPTSEASRSPWLAIVRDLVRVLTFRAPSASIAAHPRACTIVALVCTWLAGIGRYWDHPSASWWQYAGLGSVVYALALAAAITLVVAPLEPRHSSYRAVLIFVGFTAPPAWLYALPVERWVDPATARELNIEFLALVAAWRVALLLAFLVRYARLHWLVALIATLLPIVVILVALSSLNLEHAVFELMAGLREREPTPRDATYAFVIGLTYLGVLASPFVLVAYLVAIGFARQRAKQERELALNRKPRS